MKVNTIEIYRKKQCKFYAIYAPTFVDKEQSPVGYGTTENEAVLNLIHDQLKHLQEDLTTTVAW